MTSYVHKMEAVLADMANRHESPDVLYIKAGFFIGLVHELHGYRRLPFPDPNFRSVVMFAPWGRVEIRPRLEDAK